MAEEITAALLYLTSRGYAVGEAFMPVNEGRMHIWVDSIACSYEHIRVLAALEQLKVGSGAIDSPALADLAIACGKVAKNGAVDERIISEANALLHQWVVLVQSATPPPTNMHETQLINTQGQALAGRMVEFLKTQLPLLSS